MVWTRPLSVALVAAALGCGSPADPLDMDSDGADETTGTSDPVTEEPGLSHTSTTLPPDPDGGSADVDDGGVDDGTDSTDGGEDTTTDDPPPPIGCPPTPTRMVVLGDSITACFGVGGKNSDDCAPKRLNDFFAENFGPITYENLASSGAVTLSVSQSQIFNIETGIPGHVFVMIYIGGNDLTPHVLESDQEALDGWNNSTGPELAEAWEEILDFFDDPANFPDGVTLLMNTQYNPFDDYDAPPYNVSETKTTILHWHNEALMDRAASRSWAYIADQHPLYLGHGHYVDDPGCPYYDPSFEAFMGDIIHPNEAGHHHLADVMAQVAVEEIYADCG